MTMIDVLQEACQKQASDFLGSLEWPIEHVEDFWRIIESRFGKDALTRMAEFDLLKQKSGQSYRKYADLITEKAYGLGIPREAVLRKFM